MFTVTSLKRGQDVNRENGSKYRTETRQTLPQPWARSTSTVINVDTTYIGHDVMNMALYLCGLPPQTPKPQSNHEKNIRKIPTEGHSSKLLTNMPQNCQGHQRQEKSEKLSQPTGAKRTRGLKVTWWSWMVSWIRNWAFDKDQGNVNELQTVIRMWTHKTMEIKMHWICMFNWGRTWNKI